MEFKPAWRHESVIELIFEAGILRREIDRSDRVAEIRRRLLDPTSGEPLGSLAPPPEVRSFIERTFDRTYRF